MKIYKIDDQIVISDKALSFGEELTANITDGAYEKHVPVIEMDGDTVTVKLYVYRPGWCFDEGNQAESQHTKKLNFYSGWNQNV